MADDREEVGGDAISGDVGVALTLHDEGGLSGAVAIEVDVGVEEVEGRG